MITRFNNLFKFTNKDFLKAIAKSDVNSLSKIQEHIKLNKHNSLLLSVALCKAAIVGNVTVVNMLLAFPNVNVNCRIDTKKQIYTPLTGAILGGHTEIVFLLLERDDIDIHLYGGVKYWELSPFMLAAGKGNISIVTALFEKAAAKGLNPQRLTREKVPGVCLDYTALMCATWGGHAQIVQFILSKDERSDFLGSKRELLDMAIEKGYEGLVDILLPKMTLQEIQSKKYYNSKEVYQIAFNARKYNIFHKINERINELLPSGAKFFPMSGLPLKSTTHNVVDYPHFAPRPKTPSHQILPSLLSIPNELIEKIFIKMLDPVSQQNFGAALNRNKSYRLYYNESNSLFKIQNATNQLLKLIASYSIEGRIDPRVLAQKITLNYIDQYGNFHNEVEVKDPILLQAHWMLQKNPHILMKEANVTLPFDIPFHGSPLKLLCLQGDVMMCSLVAKYIPDGVEKIKEMMQRLKSDDTGYDVDLITSPFYNRGTDPYSVISFSNKPTLIKYNDNGVSRIMLRGKINGSWEFTELTGCDLCISRKLPMLDPTNNAWIITPEGLYQLNVNRDDYQLIMTPTQLQDLGLISYVERALTINGKLSIKCELEQNRLETLDQAVRMAGGLAEFSLMNADRELFLHLPFPATYQAPVTLKRDQITATLYHALRKGNSIFFDEERLLNGLQAFAKKYPSRVSDQLIQQCDRDATEWIRRMQIRMPSNRAKLWLPELATNISGNFGDKLLNTNARDLKIFWYKEDVTNTAIHKLGFGSGYFAYRTVKADTEDPYEAQWKFCSVTGRRLYAVINAMLTFRSMITHNFENVELLRLDSPNFSSMNRLQ